MVGRPETSVCLVLGLSPALQFMSLLPFLQHHTREVTASSGQAGTPSSASEARPAAQSVFPASASPARPVSPKCHLPWEGLAWPGLLVCVRPQTPSSRGGGAGQGGGGLCPSSGHPPLTQPILTSAVCGAGRRQCAQGTEEIA